MVAPKPGEPLLLYITAIAKAVNMVLVTERSEPPQPQETKETSVNDSGSQDPEPAGSPKVGVASRSQLLEASLAPKHQVGLDNATRSQPPEANSGPDDLEADGQEARCYGINIAHLSASVPVECCHVFASGTPPPHQS
jgi:hypothetical protein